LFSLSISDGRNKVTAVVGETAKLPCELTPAKKSDSAHLVLWYKELFGTPIYRFELFPHYNLNVVKYVEKFGILLLWFTDIKFNLA
jgi:hypothetical protein